MVLCRQNLITAVEGHYPSACSCYIGKHGYCHHCEALAITFVQDPSLFQVVTPKQRKDVRNLTDVQAYLQSVTLEALLTQLKDKGITQKAFAEQIGMNTRHLAAIKSSELRHHYFGLDHGIGHLV
jgi:hypothetical protein